MRRVTTALACLRNTATSRKSDRCQSRTVPSEPPERTQPLPFSATDRTVPA